MIRPRRWGKGRRSVDCIDGVTSRVLPTNRWASYAALPRSSRPELMRAGARLGSTAPDTLGAHLLQLPRIPRGFGKQPVAEGRDLGKRRGRLGADDPVGLGQPQG